MTSTTLSLPKALQATLLCVVVAIAFAESYASVSRLVGLGSWQAAAAVHTVLGVVVLYFYGRRGRLSSLAGTGAARWYAPAAVVLLGALALGLATRLSGGAEAARGPVVESAWILWIPVVEELVFRAGIGTAFRERYGTLWGAWFAAVLFALVHAAPTMTNIAAGAVGLPLGPFLLALACEALFVKSGRLLPAIALHAACNATVVVFAASDARWLRWLGFLYQ